MAQPSEMSPPRMWMLPLPRPVLVAEAQGISFVAVRNSAFSPLGMISAPPASLRQSADVNLEPETPAAHWALLPSRSHLPELRGWNGSGEGREHFQSAVEYDQSAI